ncbi:hypothetical protein F5887DRAFT_935375 [Amanita rubescens]|nr:hypothetical protein F5887DRAFT_935375 [Amanita rubescens]
METKLSESILLSNKDGCTVLVDDHLPNLLADWRYRIRQLARTDINKCRQWAERVEETLSFANRLLFLEVTQPSLSRFRLDHIPQHSHFSILLTIAAIGEALTSSKRMFPYVPRQGLSWSFIDGVADLHQKDMIQSGWCPFVTRVVGSTGICALGYASTKSPFVRDGSDGHAKCSAAACVIDNIDTSTYRNRHVVPSCECPFIKPPLEAVLQALQLGEIPVVQYDSMKNELLVLRASEISYVAISHVWADGLGSTTEGGLPTCQIQGLSKKVKQILSSDTGAFWMDSLCVPEKRELRKRAIGLMAKTYRDASATLVLDSGIRHCSVSAPLEEELLSILSCGWMHRLWTLQEGLLARCLMFAFADGLKNIDDLIPVGEDLTDCLLTNLCSEIFRLTKYQRSLRMDSGAFRIGDIVRSLVWRTTSRAEDETLAIAGLANVDARELPPNVIFMSGPKLKVPGFFWAPQALLQKGGSFMAISGEYDAICTPNGLLAEYAAVCFGLKSVRNDVQWFLFDASKNCYYKARVPIPDNPGSEYSCNALLMMKLPRPLELVVCAAVLVTGADAEEQGDRMVCEYKQRLSLEEVPQFQIREENPEDVVRAKSGRMLTRVM